MDGFSITEDDVEEPDSYENEQIVDRELEEMDQNKRIDNRKKQKDSLITSSLLQYDQDQLNHNNNERLSEAKIDDTLDLNQLSSLIEPTNLEPTNMAKSRMNSEKTPAETDLKFEDTMNEVPLLMKSNRPYPGGGGNNVPQDLTPIGSSLIESMEQNQQDSSQMGLLHQQDQ